MKVNLFLLIVILWFISFIFIWSNADVNGNNYYKNDCCLGYSENEKLNNACNYWSSTGLCPSPYVKDPNIKSRNECPCIKRTYLNTQYNPTITLVPKFYTTYPTPTPTISISIINVPTTNVNDWIEKNQSATDWYDKAISYANDKKFELALNAINQAIAINPNYKMAWGEKGYILAELQRYSEVITACNKAIDLGESEAYVWNNKGNALNSLKRYNEALGACDKALSLDPKFAYAWNGKGNALNSLNRNEEALDAYNRALLLDQGYVEAWNGKGWALSELKRYNEALDACDKALSLDPEFVYAWNGKGNALWGLKKYQDAYSAYQKAIQLDPSFNLAKENLKLLLSEHSSEINQKTPIDNSPIVTPDISSKVQTSSNAALEMKVLNPKGTYNAQKNWYDYSVQIIFKNIGGKAAQEISVYIKDLNEEEILDQYSISIIEPGKEYPDNPAEHPFTTKKKGFSVTASYYDSDESKKGGDSKLNINKLYDVD